MISWVSGCLLSPEGSAGKWPVCERCEALAGALKAAKRHTSLQHGAIECLDALCRLVEVWSISRCSSGLLFHQGSKNGSIALLLPSTVYAEVLAALYRRQDNAPTGLNRSFFAVEARRPFFLLVAFFCFLIKKLFGRKIPGHVISNWLSRTAVEGHGEE